MVHPRTVRVVSRAGSSGANRGLSAAELATAPLLATGCATGGSARTFILVAENQPAFLKVVGRHLDRNPVARQRLDAVLLHLAGGIGHDLVAGVELHAVARVGKDFGDQSFELDQLFFSHGVLQIDERLFGLLVAVGSMVRSAFAMQKRYALQSFSLAATMVRLTVRFLTAALRSGIPTTTMAAAARPFRGRCTIM